MLCICLRRQRSDSPIFEIGNGSPELALGFIPVISTVAEREGRLRPSLRSGLRRAWSRGKSRRSCKRSRMAEREGFEPSRPYGLPR